MRVSQKSAEAIVVRRLVERSEERRAKEPRDINPNRLLTEAHRHIKAPGRGNSGIELEGATKGVRGGTTKRPGRKETSGGQRAREQGDKR